MKIIPVPCLKDNYAYLIVPKDSGQALVVDPSEAAPVEAALLEYGLEPTAILNTHHHWDHVGGNEALLARFSRLRVYAHESDRGRVPGQTEFLGEGEGFQELGLKFSTRHIPGHTTGAIAYLVDGVAFTGDTLFAAGCGRLFEGTPAMMYHSLNKTLGDLPDATKIYFGHEYTESNLRFAREVEPDNAAISERLERVTVQRGRSEATTPSTWGEERATNPFVRCDAPGILKRFTEELGDGVRDPVQIFAALRSAKDEFRG